MDGVEEPERRVRRVVQPLLRSLGKHVRDQAVAHVVAERPQDVARLALPAGAERQPFEADHRVAAPVGEPVVAGDHRAHFVAHRAGARRLLDAPGGRDDELIGGQDQLRGHPRAAASTAPLRRAACAGGARRAADRSESSAPIVSHDSVDATSVPGRVGRQHQAEIAGTSRDRRSIRSRGSARARTAADGNDLGNHGERLLVRRGGTGAAAADRRRAGPRTDRRARARRTARRPDG